MEVALSENAANHHRIQFARLERENASLRFQLDWHDTIHLTIRSRVANPEGAPRALPNKKRLRTKKATNERLRNYYAENPEYRAKKLARAKADRDLVRKLKEQKVEP